MSASFHEFPLRSELDAACQEVLAWLRSIGRDGQCASGLSAGEVLREYAHLTDEFIQAIQGSGFELQIVNVGSEAAPAFDPRWTHCDNQFVGFKQPPTAQTPEHARLLACAALLRNEWCRSRLPQGAAPTASA